MRILHIVPSFGLGGMEKIICAIIDATAERHHHTVLALDACTQADVWLSKNHVKILTLDKPTSRREFFWSLFKTLRGVRPELLMTYNWGATDAVWLGRLAGIRKIIHSEHGFSIEEASQTLWARDCIRSVIYRVSTKVVVVSHELEQMLGDRFWLARRKIERIPNGVDPFYFSPNEIERQWVRQSLGFVGDQVVIGFSGRLDPVKNLNLLLEIFRASNPHGNLFRLLIIGDGPERLRLQEFCEKQGLGGYVKFVGQQRDVLPYLRAMDIFLLTSLREQMPLTILEAMSVGLPVVATSVGELPYIITDGNNGFVRDPKAALDAFVHILKCLLSSTYRQKVGAAARQTILDHFCLGKMIQAYTELMEQCPGKVTSDEILTQQ